MGSDPLNDLVAEWKLALDGAADGSDVPVRADGVPATLTVDAAEHAHLVLRRWNGDGAVRLLRADPHRRALLLERTRAESLESLDDAEACEIVAGLYPRLHVSPMPQLPSLATLLPQWAAEFDGLPRSAPIPHRLVEQAATLCRDLAAEPVTRVLHGDLHFANVHAADREPWLAVAPEPVNGDPAFEIAPMLWHRWDEMADSVRWSVQRRFFAMVDAAGFDEDRARGHVIIRIVRAAVDALAAGPADLTRLVTLAKAVQD